MSQVNKKVAVVDLGSNTFHAVIFEKKKTGEILEVYRKRHHVFLSKNGIETIMQESIDRAHIAIEDFQKNFEIHNPDEIYIVGTEALRKASNGKSLASYIENKLHATVDIISGKREAELIAKGVMWQMDKPIKEALIMDIGGGSVEFIHIINNQVAWMHSFPVGIGVLYNKFPHQEPISSNEKTAIIQFLEIELLQLISYLGDKSIPTLIGASGSFELIPAIIEGQYPPEIGRSSILLNEFHEINNRILKLDMEERLHTKGLPPVRAKLVVVAFVIMEWIVQTLKCEEILVSKYAVKEGLIAEKLEI